MIGIDYFPKNKMEWRKGYTAFRKHQRAIKKTIDKACSLNPLTPRDEIEEAVLWRLHMKGARYPSWHEYKTKMYTSPSKMKKTILEAFKLVKEG